MSIERFTILEDSSYELTLTWRNEDGNAIALAEVSTLTLTYYQRFSGDIINSRSDQNVLNTNNVTYHATSGLMTWTVQPADTAITDTALDIEAHRALFEIQLTSGARGKKEVDLYVTNLVKV